MAAHHWLCGGVVPNLRCSLDPTGTGVYCVCANVLISQVDTLRNLAYICMAVALAQFVVFLMALRLLGIDMSKVIGDDDARALSRRGAKTIV